MSLPSPDMQELWFRTRAWNWSSLVVVPAEGTFSVAAVAQGLARVGGALGEGAPRVVSAEEMTPAEAATLVAELSRPRNPSSMLPAERGSQRDSNTARVIVSITSVLENPLAIGIAQAADAVLLAIRIRESTLRAAQRTMELIGREKFIGSVTLRLARSRR